MNIERGTAARHGIAVGEPVICRCGREMVCIASEQLKSGYGGHKYPVGTRYIYRCQGCPRRLEVRWVEKYVPQGEPGPSGVEGRGGAA